MHLSMPFLCLVLCLSRCAYVQLADWACCFKFRQDLLHSDDLGREKVYHMKQKAKGLLNPRVRRQGLWVLQAMTCWNTQNSHNQNSSVYSASNMVNMCIAGGWKVNFHLTPWHPSSLDTEEGMEKGLLQDVDMSNSVGSRRLSRSLWGINYR